MAGHSQFRNIMYRKGAQDARRSRLFTRLAREITVAARSGLADPEKNPRLRAAIAAARDANMPKDGIARAVRRGTGEEGGEALEEVRYEGYGPGGVAIIVEAVTDNRNRTAAALRSAFGRHGGSLGETNSAAPMFERIGAIRYPAKSASAEAMFEAALEAGAEDVESSEAGHEVTCAPDDLNAVRDALEARFGTPDFAGLTWRPQATTPVAEPSAGPLFRLLEALEENDDVQSVWANYEVPDELMTRLTA